MKSLKKSAILIAILLVSSKLLGVVREICMAHQFGTSYIVDAYTISAAFPTVLFTLFAEGFADSYIPIHMRTAPEKQPALFNRTLTVLELGSAILVGLTVLFRRQIVMVLAPGFDVRSAALAQLFVVIVVFQLPLYVAFALFSARTSAEEDFLVQNFCNFVLVNLILIASVQFASEENPTPLAYGFVVAMGAALIVLATYTSRRYHIRFHPVFDFHDPAFLQLCAMALPLGASLLVNQLNTVIDRMFSSALGEGITSALGYADKLQSILLTLTTSIFLTVCYPRMNRCFAAGERAKGVSYAKKAAMIACYSSIPLLALFMVYAEPIVRLIFQRGSFTETSTAYTATCLRFYAVGILFFAIRTVETNVLAANTCQRLILKNTIITVICNVLLNAVLISVMGYAGLAFATSLSGLIACLLFFHDLHRQGIHLLDRLQAVDMGKELVSTFVCIGCSILVYRLLLPLFGNDVTIVLTVGFVGIMYLVCSILFQIEIFVWLYRQLPVRFQAIPILNRYADDRDWE